MDDDNQNNVDRNPEMNNPQPLAIQPRQPQNLQGLLRFAMEARQPEAEPIQELPPMDNERRAFLARALQNMVTDAVVILRTAIPVLTNTQKIGELADKEELTTEVKAVFESVLDVIEDLDFANDFCKLGGFDAFSLCYNTKNPELWLYTNNLLAGVCQNYTPGQALAFERGLLHKQLQLLRDPETKNKEKFIYAISCSVREYEPGSRTLIELNGCETLAPLLREEDERLQMKAACLLQYLLKNYAAEVHDRILALDILKLLVPQLAKPFNMATEHLLRLVHTFVYSSVEALQQARVPDIGLKEPLEKFAAMGAVSDESEYQEVIKYSTESLTHVFGGDIYDCADEADR